MFLRLKRIVPLLLVLSLLLVGCGKTDSPEPDASPSGQNGSDSGNSEKTDPGTSGDVSDPGTTVSDPSSPTGAVSDTKTLIGLADACKTEGDRFTNLLMDETAAYFYGMSGTVLSSLRLAAERILWLKGEGENFASLAEGSRYTDWDTIAEICYASPYPYYFEGLLYDVQGETEKASELYSYSSIMTNFPEEGLDFYFLKDMTIDDLYKLRDELRQKEEDLYSQYTPVLYGLERSVYNGISEYLFADAMEKLEQEKYRDAFILARYAVRQNPKSEEYWILAVIAALSADEPYLAIAFLDEGFKYFPESEKLTVLLNSIKDIDAEIAKEVNEE